MSHTLIVDDKEENIYYLRSLLTGHGCEVESACHGAEALVKARRSPPDLIISDLLMPVMDGYTLLRLWKSDERLKDIPFIVYTATYTDAEDERLALSLGADAFILKPAEPAEFLDRVNRVRQEVATVLTRKPQALKDDENELLKVYSETLIRKLEKKTMQLEEANRALQRDLADRERAEVRIREQAALLDAAHEAIYVIALDDFILYWNKGAERSYGWTKAEAVGRKSVELFYKDYTKVPEARAKLLEKAEWQGELIHQTKDGREIIMEAHWTLVLDGEGLPKSVLAINTDISDKKNLEVQFLRAQRMESIGTLAGGIAHDLNNVLAPIMMAMEILKDYVQDEEGLSLLVTLQASAQRGSQLVKQVLTFARGVEGERVNINPLLVVIDLINVLRETFPKSIEVCYTPPKELWTVTGDRTQMHQVLLNLCLNARDAMPRSGKLTLAMENVTVDDTYAAMHINARPGAYMMVRVEDSGSGIPKDIQGKIFEPFFTTKEIGKGTGLGLSTTMAIVRSHGGFINVYSEEGRGTKFKVYFPANTQEVATVGATSEINRHPRGNGEWVLVVEDEEAIRKIAQHTLERFGYHVLLAIHGAEAIVLYTENQAKIAVVLTDMAMPVMDGPATIRALKSINPRVKIIGSSGLTSHETLTQLMEEELENFLHKPYTTENLLKTLHQTLHPEGA